MNKLLYLLVAMAWLFILVGCAPAAPTGGEAAPAATEAPAPTQIPSSVEPTAAPTQLPAIPEARRLTLEWPPEIKVGDSDVLRLVLEIDPEGGIMTATAVVEGHEVRSETVLVPNLYETHNVLAEARLDLAGVEVTPTGEISEPMLPGEPVTFFWSVRPEQVGTYRGTIWVHLRFIPKDGGPESRKTLTAQQVEVRAVNLLGLSGNAARWMGVLGTLVGSSLSLEKVFSWIFSRVRKKKTPQPQA